MNTKQKPRKETVMKKYQNAFSLIEILVGLIIISVALAAFAPTMNKKVRAQSTAIDTKLTTKCTVTAWNGKCTLCQGTKFCVQCARECSIDEKLNIAECKCE